MRFLHPMQRSFTEPLMGSPRYFLFFWIAFSRMGYWIQTIFWHLVMLYRCPSDDFDED